jgi:hypothetical protein
MKTTRVTPSLVVAVLALVVSLAGTGAMGYAAGRAHGTVPHASVADALPAPALVPLTAFGLWTVGTDRACGARKDAAGFVHLQGDIGLHVISANTPMTVLPPGYRPAGTTYFGVGSGTNGATPGVVRVSADGGVVLVAGDSPYVALDSIEFYAAG